MTSAVDLSLPHLGRCLRIEQAFDVVDALIHALPGWPITVQPALGPMPDRYIYRDTKGLWQGSFLEPNEFHLPSPASAACSLVGDLVSQRLLNQPELLGLHCASVEINGRLVVFPESSKAGKSTLAVAFSAAGYRIFGDDVLGLTAQGEGVAMGAAPRLRLPFPESFSPEFVAYADRHTGPEDDRYRFVIPADNGLANYNETCPVGAIVLLERDSSISEPEVITLPPAEGLLQLLCQNFASDSSSEVLLARLVPLMAKIPCVLLRYSEPLAGARYLAQLIKAQQLPNAHHASLLSMPSANGQPNIVSLRLNDQWQPHPAVTDYSLGDELFLIHTNNGVIHRLNSSGKIAWLLLQQQPLSVLILSELLAQHFFMPLDSLSGDVTQLVTALAQAKLIVPCSG